MPKYTSGSPRTLRSRRQKADACPRDRTREIRRSGRSTISWRSSAEARRSGRSVAPGSIVSGRRCGQALAGDHPVLARLGFYGDEARAHPGPALTAVLSRFQQFQTDDQRIRQLAQAGHSRQAVTLLTGRTAGSASYDFDQYDQAIVSLIGLHRGIFDQAIRTGDRDLGRSILGDWAGLLPLAALGAAILVVAGVRPRLAEYR